MHIKKNTFLLISLIISNIAYSDNRIPQNTINWILDRDHIQKPRGGNTNGLPTEIDISVSKYFNSFTKIS